jgi:hypothetical protein
MAKKKNPLKSAHKILKFWFSVLLETELMNDTEHRKEFLVALDVVKQNYKKQKGN